jgi:GYF domain 2/Domain of unknown function (DUF4234)
MASEWFYTVNGQQSQSSASDAQLKQMATSGQLQPGDMVWKDGMPNWVAANTIKGLFPASLPASGEFPAAEPTPAKKPARKATVEANNDEGESGGGILGMHPILVFVLSSCTGGIFGLVYVYLVCSAYSAREQHATDSAGRPLGKLRHPLAVYILSVLTLGLYYYYWVYKTIQECAAFTGRKDITARIDLALMLILPPWAIYVSAFRLPEMIRAAQAQAKQPEAGALAVAPFFIIPCLAPALPFLAMAFQDALNQVWVSSS